MSEALETEVRITGIEDYISAMKEIRDSIMSVGTVSDETNKQIRELSKPIYAMRRTITATHTAFKVYHAAMFETLRIMRSFEHIGKDILQIWQAYQIGMIRVGRAQEDVTDATKDVAFWQDRYNEYLRDFGADSVYTQEALANLEQAQRNLKSATESVASAQQEMNVFYVSSALMTAGFVADITMTVVALKSLSTTIGGWSGLAATISTHGATMIAVLGGIGGVAASLTVGLGALAAAFVMASKPVEVQIEGMKNLTEAMVDFEEHGKWAIDNLDKQKEAFEDAAESAHEYGGVVDDLFKRSPLPDLVNWLQTSQSALKEMQKQFGTDEIKGFGEQLNAINRNVFPTIRLKISDAELGIKHAGAGANIRQVQINNYNEIASDLDVKRITEETYKQLMRRLNQLW